MPVEHTYERDDVPSAVVDIGWNRSDITEQTDLHAIDENGNVIFPEGISLYATTDSFKGDVSYGGTLVTRRYSNGTGYQIYKPFYYSYNFIRRAGNDGVWGSWSITNRAQYYKEG